MAKVNRYNTTAEKEAADKERTKLEISSKNKNTPKATEMPKFKHKGMSEERFDEIASKIRKGERVSFAEMSELAKVGIDPDEFIETLSKAVTTKYDDDPSISTDNSVLDEYHPDVATTHRIEEYFTGNPEGEQLFRSMEAYRDAAFDAGNSDKDIDEAFVKWGKENGLTAYLRKVVPEKEFKEAVRQVKNFFTKDSSQKVRDIKKEEAKWHRKEKTGQKAQNTANKFFDLQDRSEDEIIALALDKKHPDHDAAATIVGNDPTLMGKALTKVPRDEYSNWKYYFKQRPKNTARTSQEVAGAEGTSGTKRLFDLGEAINEINLGKRYSKEEWQQMLKDNPDEEFTITINRDPIHKEKDDLWNKQMSVSWNKGQNVAKVKGLKAMGDFLVGTHGHARFNEGASFGSGERTESEAQFADDVSKMISTGDPRVVYKNIYGDGSKDEETEPKERKPTVTEDKLVEQGKTEKDVSLKYYDKMFKQTGEELQAVQQMLTELDPESDAYTRYKAKEATLFELLNKYRDARKKELIPSWRKRHNLNNPAFDEFLENDDNRKKVASAFNKLDAWAKDHTETVDMHTDFDIALSNAIQATAKELGVPEEEIKDTISEATAGLNERKVNKNGVAGKFTPGAIRQTIRNIKENADADRKEGGDNKTIWTALDENLALRWDKDLQDRVNRRSALSPLPYKDVLGDEMYEDLFGDTTSQFKAAGLTDDEIAALDDINRIQRERGISINQVVFDPKKGTYVLSLNKNADGSDRDTYTRHIPGKGGRVQSVKVGGNNKKYINDTYVDSSGQVHQDTLHNRLSYNDAERKQEQDKLSGVAEDFAERQKDADRRNDAARKANKVEERELANNAQNYLQNAKDDEASGKAAKNAQESRQEHADFEAKAKADRERNAKSFTGTPDTSIEGIYASEQTRKLAEKNKTAKDRAKESANNLDMAKKQGVSGEALANLEKNKRLDEADAKAAKERREAEEARKKAEQEQREAEEAQKKEEEARKEAWKIISRQLAELGRFK